jgi:CubicO group peptidase (beta-lactamase class C family)
MIKLCLTIAVLTISQTSVVWSQGFSKPEDVEILSLIQKFSSEDPFINGETVSKLSEIGEPAVKYLIKSLQSEEDNVRWCSSIALEKIAPKGTKAIPFLAEALKDNNSNVRWCCAVALGKFKEQAKSSVANLLSLLYDDDRDVRWAAYVSLSKIDKDAINKTPQISDVVAKLEILTPQLMNELEVPGVSISVIKNNTLAWSKSFGAADAVSKNPVNRKTMFEACSMSKPVFTYLVLKLVEQQKFELDAPLYNYLPEEFISDDENYSKQITARMILTHTGGFPNWRKGGEEREGPLPIYFKPGTKFNYSGEGFFFLQRVFEHITKQSLDVFAKRTLFDEIGLESTSFVWNEKLNPHIATGHDTSGNCKERSKYLHANAAYTLYTTSEEYAKFIIEIMKSKDENGFSLSDEMVEEMLTHQVRVDTREVIDRPGRNFGLQGFRGLGWIIDSTITGNIVYHSGSNQTGFRCYSQFNPKESAGIVIMTNGENGNELWRRLISVIGDL